MVHPHKVDIANQCAAIGKRFVADDTLQFRTDCVLERLTGAKRVRSTDSMNKAGSGRLRLLTSASESVVGSPVPAGTTMPLSAGSSRSKLAPIIPATGTAPGPPAPVAVA